MRTVIRGMLALAISGICSSVIWASSDDGGLYEAAIGDAPADGIDRRWQLRQCLKNWEGRKTEPAIDAIAKFNDATQSDQLSVLLEIGSSAALRHDFIFVQDSLMRSSFSNEQKSIYNSLLEAELHRLVDKSLTGLTGRASSPVLDGNCYFLSVRKGEFQQTVALYGLLTKAKTDQLIRDLISAATASSSL